MKKTISTFLTVFTLFGASLPVMANRSESETYKLAKQVLPNASHLTSEVKTIGSDTLYYTYKSATGGYAIVSAKEQTPALLAYNKSQRLTDKEAAHIGEFLTTYYHNLSNLQLARAPKHGNSLKLSKLTGCAIAPLLGATAWGQETPYNQTCPTISGEIAPTGCVATAMAQVMYYHKHPFTLQADIPAYKTETNGIAIEGISKGTTIDWKNILNTYEDGYSKTNATAVANLLKMVGTSLKMDYKSNESSAATPCILELTRYFGYDADLIRRAYRSSFTLEEWYDIIYNELKEKRPVIMSGSTMKSGHRFVCDGIDENGLFHINWGWDGNFNGYYDLTVLNPNTTSEVGASTSKDGYTKENYIVIGITPNNGEKDAHTTTNVVSTNVKHQITNGNNYLFYSYANPYATIESAYLASGYIDEEGKVVLVGSASDNTLEPISAYEQQTALPIRTSNFKEGKLYKVGLMESLDGKNWAPCEGYNNVSVTFTVKNGKVVVASEYKLSAELTVTDYNKVGTYSYGFIDLKNDGDKEYLGVVYLMTNSENVNPMKYSHAATVTVEANNTNQMEVFFIPKSDTTYYWIMDKNNALLKEGFVIKGNGLYKLTGSAKIDTLNNGSLECRVTLTNNGNALYSGRIETTLLHEAGSITSNKEEVIVKAGATIEYSFCVENNHTFTNYIITDYEAKNFAIGSFTTSTNGKMNLYDNYSPFNGKGNQVNGFISITNFSNNTLSRNLRLTVSEDEDGEETEIYNKDITVKSSDLGVFEYETTAIADSFYLHIYLNGTKISTDLISRRATSAQLNKANQDIHIEVIGQTLIVTTLSKTELAVYNTKGSCIVRKPLACGETFTTVLKPGIYLVNGKKIIVKQ